MVFHRTARIPTDVRFRGATAISRGRRAFVCRSIHRLGTAGGSPFRSDGRRSGGSRYFGGKLSEALPGEFASTLPGGRSFTAGGGARLGGKSCAVRAWTAAIRAHAAQMKKAGEYSEEDTHRPACH